jgi:hypothetical protein
MVWPAVNARNLSVADMTMILDTPLLKLAPAYKAEDCYFWSRL